MKTKGFDYNSILPISQMNFYLENFLIENKDFLKDIEHFMPMFSSNSKEKLEIIRKYYHHPSRHFLLKILVLKHLTKMLLDKKEYYIEPFWQSRLNEILN